MRLRAETLVTALSDNAVLIYILAETGVRGQLNSGWIERGLDGTLNVYDARGTRFDYLSGNRVRSWCVVNRKGEPIEGWREVVAEDLPRFGQQ